MRNLFEHPLFIIVLLVLLAVLFGGKRLPEAARGLGRSMRIFKSEMKQMGDEDKQREAEKKQPPVEGRIIDPAPPSGAGNAAPSADQRDTR